MYVGVCETKIVSVPHTGLDNGLWRQKIYFLTPQQYVLCVTDYDYISVTSTTLLFLQLLVRTCELLLVAS